MLSTAGAPPSFDRIAVVPNFADANTFEILRDSAYRGCNAERVTIPGHKRGATVAYGSIRIAHPEIARFYQSAALLRDVSAVIGQSVGRTPPHDQSSCSILIYDRPGDRIGWHLDHNFYDGRHFTALLPLVNQGSAEGGLSSAHLLVRLDGQETEIATPPNTLVLFEGARVRHCVTSQGKDELRIVLSMTFCTDPGTSLRKDILRRIKDIAYIGVRALWT